MSLKPEPIGPIPQETARVAKAACPERSTFIQMRDASGMLFEDSMFANLFALMVSQLWPRGDWLW